MITIFRKIRQKLIANNSVSKYLIYAIGEILLVVIGILIAVQVNAAYENGKKNDLKKVYVNNLINDLSKDTLQLSTNLKLNLDSFLVNSDSVINFINNQNTTVEDIKEYAKTKGGFSGLRTVNTYNTNTYNLLVSTGNIDLFKDAVIQEIMELNRLQKLEKTISTGNRNTYFNQLNNYQDRYLLYLKSNLRLTETVWDKVDATKHAPIFTNTVFLHNHAITRYVNLTTDVFSKTKKLLNTLKTQ
tara:strand:- start:12188 stop:12919 length:732 start_codon:yes stop_codon:yes gene_type:complete